MGWKDYGVTRMTNTVKYKATKPSSSDTLVSLMVKSFKDKLFFLITDWTFTYRSVYPMRERNTPQHQTRWHTSMTIDFGYPRITGWSAKLARFRDWSELRLALSYYDVPVYVGMRKVWKGHQFIRLVYSSTGMRRIHEPFRFQAHSGLLHDAVIEAPLVSQDEA